MLFQLALKNFHATELANGLTATLRNDCKVLLMLFCSFKYFSMSHNSLLHAKPAEISRFRAVLFDF